MSQLNLILSYRCHTHIEGTHNFACFLTPETARITSSSGVLLWTGSGGRLNLFNFLLNTNSYPFCAPLSRAALWWSTSGTGPTLQVNAILCTASDSARNVFCRWCLFLPLSLRLSLCRMMSQKLHSSSPLPEHTGRPDAHSTAREKVTSETGRSGFDGHLSPLLAL